MDVEIIIKLAIKWNVLKRQFDRIVQPAKYSLYGFYIYKCQFWLFFFYYQGLISLFDKIIYNNKQIMQNSKILKYKPIIKDLI